MQRQVKFGSVLLGVIAVLICAFLLCGCGSRKAEPAGEKPYVEKSDVKEDGIMDRVPEIKITSVSIEGEDVLFGIAVSGEAVTNAELKIESFVLTDAAYKDTGGVICYTGKKTSTGVSRTEKLEIPVSDRKIKVGGAGVSDGKTRMITVKVKDEGSGKTGEGTLLLRDGTVLLSEAAAEIVAASLTYEEMASLVVGNWTDPPVAGEAGATTPIPRLGVPALSLADGPQGVRMAVPTIWYPCGAVMASTWNRETVYRVGASLGNDCDSCGVDVILGPGMNIQRVVVGGRNFEYFSEDPYLTGIVAAAYSSGVQSRGIGVSAKHYAMNNQETARGTVSARVNERAAREIYLRGFGYLVRKADPYTVMSSYNRVNGVYSSVNKALLDVLREDFGFGGFIMTDWGASGDMADRMNSGNDLTEPGSAEQQREILSALMSGKIEENACRLCCVRILRVVAKSKAYEKMMNGRERASGEIDVAGGQKAALAAAAEGMVLLKNEGNALPVKKNTELALIGTAAYDPTYGGEGSGGVTPSAPKSVRAGLAEAGYSIQAKAERWFSYSNKLRSSFDEEVLSWADSCEAAVIFIGRRSSEGADNEKGAGGFLLTEEESAMIGRTAAPFHAKGKKVIVVINSGNPVETASWRDLADAIIWVGYPGETYGTAFANILSGKESPSGKLTCTWPETYESTPYFYDFPGTGNISRYRDDIYVGYRFYEEFGVNVAYPFGHGLTYTDFEYSDFEVTENANGTFTLSCSVKNTGGASAKEVVEFYVTKPETDGLLPLKKELCGFDKTPLLKPGESVRISVTVTDYELESFFTEDMSWKVAAGDYVFHAAATSSDVRASRKITVNETKVTRTVRERVQPGEAVEVISPGRIEPETETRPSIALGKNTYCSGTEAGYTSAKAVDGDNSTRWSAAGTSGIRWIIVDLGEVRKVSDVTILWESNKAYRYTVAVSADTPEREGRPGTSQIPKGIVFTDVLDAEMQDWDLDKITLNAEVRFIKISIPADASWCSIFEISVYEGS